jgi:hypothetical protein
MASIPSNGYREVMAGSNVYTGSNLYGSICPQTPLPPVVSDDLVNKLYVDALVGGGTVVSVSGGTNINMTGTLPAPIVNLRNPLTAVLNIGTQDITGSTGQIIMSDPVTAISQSTIEANGISVINTATPAENSSLTNSGILVQTAADGLFFTPTIINKTGAAPLAIVSVASNIELNTPTVVTTSGSFQPATILDTFAGGAGTAGQVLSSLGGAGTKWIAGGGGGGTVTSIGAGLNIGIDSTVPAVPVVRVLQPLTSVLDIGTQNITGTAGYINMLDSGVPATQSFTRASSVSVLDTTSPSIYSEMTKAQLIVNTATSAITISNSTIAKTGVPALTISSLASNIALNTPNVVTTSGSFQPATVLDTFASAAGTVGQVLSSLGGAGTKWITNAAGFGDLNDTLALGNTATGSYATITLNDTDTGGLINPILTLNNTNATGSVCMEIYKNKPTIGTAGDILFNQSVYGKDTNNTKQEYSRVTHTLRDPTNSAEDASIELGVVQGGTIQTYLQLNGFDNDVNCLKTLDMNGNNIKSDTGSLLISTASSSGDGVIALTSKTAATGSITLTANGGGNISITSGSGTLSTTANTSTFNSNIASNFNAPYEYHSGNVVTSYSTQVYQSTYQPFLISTPISFPPIGQFQREGQMTMLVNSLGDGGNELNITPTPDFTVTCMAFPLVGGGIIVGGYNNFDDRAEVRRGAALADVTNNAGTFLRINFPVPNSSINCLFINDSLFPNRVAIGGRMVATTADSYNGVSNFPSNAFHILLADTTAGALTPLSMLDTTLFQTFGLDDEVYTINAQQPPDSPPTVAGGACYILGGVFQNALGSGSVPANHVVFMAADPQTGFQFSSDLFLEVSNGADADVRSIQVLNDKIVFGGDFTTIYNSPTPYLAFTDSTNPFACNLLGSSFQPTGGATIYVGREAYNTASGIYFSYVGTTLTDPTSGTPYDLLKIDMNGLTAGNPTVEKAFANQVTGIGVNNVGGVGQLSFCGGFKLSSGLDAFVWDFITPQFIDVNGYTLPWNIDYNTQEGRFYVFKDPNNTSSPPQEMAYIAELLAGPIVISTDATTLPFVPFSSPTNKFNTLTLTVRNAFAMGTLCGFGTDDVRMLFYSTNNAAFSNV